MSRGKLWSPIPTPEQELLLKICVGYDPVASWNAWRALVAVEDLDLASQRLLPLAYEELRKAEVSHPDMERYRIVARYVWYDNQVRIGLVERVLDAFDSAGIPILLLKGIALTPLYYKNWGLRPANDTDILVPPERAHDAARLLNDLGWHCSRSGDIASPMFRSTIHALEFESAQNISIDLHWHALHDRCQEDADALFWKHAQPVALNVRQARTPGDTEQLFHVCLHAVRRNQVAPIRWIADAAMILRNSTIDWDRFARHAIDGRFSRSIAIALRCLKDRFALAVPADVLARMEAERPSSVERLEEQVNAGWMPRVLRSTGRRYLHYQRNRDAAAAPANFIAYMETIWGLSSRNQTLREIFKHLQPQGRSAREE